MARNLTIRNLSDEHRRALGELAIREYREADDQAAYLIVDGLRRAGVLASDRAGDAERQPTEAAS